MDTIINNWVDEPYMNILLYQYEDTRIITEKLDKLEDNRKIISKSFVIGLLKNLNNILLFYLDFFLVYSDNKRLKDELTSFSIKFKLSK